jgi:hypothetical protein
LLRVFPLKPRTVMSSIMLVRNALTGRSEGWEVIRDLSRAEGCWTFDARDRIPDRHAFLFMRSPPPPKTH